MTAVRRPTRLTVAALAGSLLGTAGVVAALGLGSPSATAAGDDPVPQRTSPVPTRVELLGRDNGFRSDRLRVRASSVPFRTPVVLKVVEFDNGEASRRTAATSVIDSTGRAVFLVADTNGDRRTRYFARVKASDSSAADRSNTVAVR